MSHRYEVGVRLLRGGQIDEAIQELQAARGDPRLRWQSLMQLGHCFKARNNWRLAQRNFEEALRLLPVGEAAKQKEVLFLLAQGCAEAGDLATPSTWATSWPTSTSPIATSAGCSTSGRRGSTARTRRNKA